MLKEVLLVKIDISKGDSLHHGYTVFPRLSLLADFEMHTNIHFDIFLTRYLVCVYWINPSVIYYVTYSDPLVRPFKEQAGCY